LPNTEQGHQPRIWCSVADLERELDEVYRGLKEKKDVLCKHIREEETEAQDGTCRTDLSQLHADVRFSLGIRRQTGIHTLSFSPSRSRRSSSSTGLHTWPVPW
jgi:hypothetical protein